MGPDAAQLGVFLVEADGEKGVVEEADDAENQDVEGENEEKSVRVMSRILPKR